MNVVAILGTVAVLLLLPLIVASLRQRTLFRMAIRNISRRRAEAILVVAGALLGTAIITSSLVVGDVIEASFADSARTEYGPVDITVTASNKRISPTSSPMPRPPISGRLMASWQQRRVPEP